MPVGGTELYCTECKTMTKQKSLGWGDKNKYEGICDDPGKYSFGHPKGAIETFMRIRECEECSYVFETYEISGEDFICLYRDSNKLLNLKSAIDDSMWSYKDVSEE